jgi:hypothetical protein
MKNEIEIYVHTEADCEAKLIKVNPEITVEDLLRLVSPERHHELLLILEEEDTPKERHHRLAECGIQHGHHVHCHPHVIHYLVDDDEQKTKHHKLTPVEIMTKAVVDSATHYLIRLYGVNEQESYRNDPNKVIHMHNRMKFITCSLEPTPVS